MEISIPIILSNLCLTFLDQISLLFVGQIGDTEQIAAVGPDAVTEVGLGFTTIVPVALTPLQ